MLTETKWSKASENHVSCGEHGIACFPEEDKWIVKSLGLWFWWLIKDECITNCFALPEDFEKFFGIPLSIVFIPSMVSVLDPQNNTQTNTVPLDPT